MFRAFRTSYLPVVRAAAVSAGVFHLTNERGTSCASAVDFPEIKYSLSLATWIYHFGKDLPSAKSVPFTYGVHSEPISHVLGQDETVGEKVSLYLSDTQSGLQMATFYNKARNKIYVVFRGSESSELKDWLQDATVVKDELGNGISVHRGFNSILQQSKGQIFNAVKELQKAYPTAEIVVTGHSLGGALSTLFGYFAALEFPKTTVRVHSFASPRVGDDEFRKAHDKLTNLTHVRVVNNRDAVTAAPSINYAHVGKTVLHLTDDGLKKYENYQYPLWTFTMAYCYKVDDHYTSSYWERLHQCKW